LVRELARAMPRRHLEFPSQLRLTFTCGDLFFVRPGVPLAEQQEDDLPWIREEFLKSQQNFGKFVVHGHTPVRHPELLKNRANIDTGAYATGNLTLMTIQGTSMLAV
jgi:serine/threonine protein phosphatase 1